MNAIVNGQPVQQGKLKRLDLTKETFQWKNGLYIVDLSAIKIERVKWPQKQRLVIDYNIKKTLPMTYDKREYVKDAVFVATTLGKGTIKSVIKSDQTIKMIALVAMIMALVAMGAAMYAWTNPEEVLELKQRGKTPAKTSPTAGLDHEVYTHYREAV